MSSNVKRTGRSDNSNDLCSHYCISRTLVEVDLAFSRDEKHYWFYNIQ